MSVYRDLPDAQVIFEGIVVGVELTGYKEYLADKYEKEEFSTNEYPINLMDTVAQHSLSIFVTSVEVGELEAGKVIEVIAGGCGAERPQLEHSGKFYYFPKRNYVLPRYK